MFLHMFPLNCPIGLLPEFSVQDLGLETLNLKVNEEPAPLSKIKKTITVSVIGLSNVDKSSLINSLKRAHVVNVGATPGLTRSMQEVQLDKNIKLLDCPGVVMLKSLENDTSVALLNCKRIEKIDDPISLGMQTAFFLFQDFSNLLN
ncbi:Guanine nucleotide-binding protein-like [Arachis hypogaea]|nr:Guanine nucleotide-binding protein-like [Arachis hypogaea]